MTAAPPALEMSAVTKQYGALRPLRIERLTVAAGEQVALVGLDQPAAEVFINLVTGAALPDTGQIRVFGRATSDIRDSDDWLTTLDRFGIVSDRSALLEGLSVVQNLAVPFSLEIEPPSDDNRRRATDLAREVGVPERLWEVRAADLDNAARIRARVARALALGPSILLLEHPTATIGSDQAASVARDIRRVAERRGAATIAITMDKAFAAAAGRVLTLDPATGRLKDGRFGRISFWS